MADPKPDGVDGPLEELELPLSIPKIEAAGRQLATAAHLFMHDGDPVSVHTLTAAAYDIIRDVNKARGGAGMFTKDLMLSFVPVEQHRAVRQKLNKAQNFFKHANRDPEGVLKFRPFATVLLLFDASIKYHELTGATPTSVKVFHYWLFITHPQLIRWPLAAAAAWAERVAANGRELSRREFWDFAGPLVAMQPDIITNATHDAVRQQTQRMEHSAKERRQSQGSDGGKS